MNPGLHHKTPTLKAVDSRGLPVRQVAYCRRNAEEQSQARITRQHHDTAGRQVAQWDPRLFDTATEANLTTVYSLSGKPLLVNSVDAGWRLNLPGAAGQIVRSWDQRGNHWRTTYDQQLRPTAIHEQLPDQDPRRVECLRYGDSSPESASRNLCGALIRHDDSAGSLLVHEYALCGKPLGQARHFLVDAAQPDWPAEEIARDKLLEKGNGYETRWRYDALAHPILLVDAARHQQRYGFDIAGQLKVVSLKVKDATTEKTILKDLVYNASGQVESQVAGNGVISRAAFDPASGRLISLSASVSGNTLQDLRYTYDAVGNVTHIEDRAQPVQFGSNQRVDATCTFTYDSLYQLSSATGRETAGLTSNPELPAFSRTPFDARQLFPFTEHYQYDAGGNLIELRHVRDRNNYTRKLEIAASSNRLLSWNKAEHFDANGNPQVLHPGRALEWNARNQLASVTLVQRADGRHDLERYGYDSTGQRVRKVQVTYASAVTHTREVRYLPGLETHTRQHERLEVITLQAGRCSVRYLHWTEGRPAGIAANQTRYSLDDHLGSSSLELDDEGWLISQESYLPYGGTAWAASRSAVEADYRTLRYSGKERDASGLYYYGHRYYAPWLQRWISPDPAGAVDGLNLYCMVGNNPMRFTDPSGLMRDEDFREFETWGRARSKEIMDSARGKYSYRLMPDDYDKTSDQFLNGGLLRQEFLAHSYGYIKTEEVGLSDFFNLPKPQGSMRGYKGVDRHYDGWARTHTPQQYYLNYGTYRIGNTTEYLADLSSRYAAAKNDLFHNVAIDEDVLKDAPTLSRLSDQVHELQQPTRDWIETHIANMAGIMPIRAGGPGTHAEVRLANSVVALYPDRAERMLSDTTIFTDTLFRGKAPEPFPACINCSGILPAQITVPTGRSPVDYAGYNARVQQINEAPRPRQRGNRARR
ncbi:insecticidal toxin complex protein TccC [Pseudomonas sp. NFACC23-1]|uniref:RHS repeat-associated core domain-containing protein n=1 Tax=unclassified Pseudomonas TaxID=196821 RepID=UPI00088DBF71|nr:MULTISPECIES: RHS repeat-associated core domain-containing protein [unclassified Pseudomonas]SDB09431.1 insecticidal toxin complex protein TccC [Pseudomonas sp. NFACC17-2]SEJ04423.1 insecticidal toxin complex protein TccC [Pseudomonas sp. NFACC23-1]SFW37732.1 insecticidal toxin complex protein TccC [Pseudomonas sp. NFACC16-2]